MKHTYPFLSASLLVVCLIVGSVAYLLGHMHPIAFLPPWETLDHKHPTEKASALAPNTSTITREQSFFVKWREVPANPMALLPPIERQAYRIVSFKPAFRLAAMRSVYVLTIASHKMTA